MADQDHTPGAGAGDKPEEPPQPEHLNIKVTDNNNEVFFKIKRTTALKKLMDAFCDRQGKMPNQVRFLFDGARVQPTDTPQTVSHPSLYDNRRFPLALSSMLPSIVSSSIARLTSPQLEMQDGDTLEVHQEQIGGC
jgi:hypothetical protein